MTLESATFFSSPRPQLPASAAASGCSFRRVGWNVLKFRPQYIAQFGIPLYDGPVGGGILRRIAATLLFAIGVGVDGDEIVRCVGVADYDDIIGRATDDIIGCVADDIIGCAADDSIRCAADDDMSCAADDIMGLATAATISRVIIAVVGREFAVVRRVVQFMLKFAPFCSLAPSYSCVCECRRRCRFGN